MNSRAQRRGFMGDGAAAIHTLATLIHRLPTLRRAGGGWSTRANQQQQDFQWVMTLELSWRDPEWRVVFTGVGREFAGVDRALQQQDFG